MDELLPEKRKVKPEQLIKLFHSKHIDLNRDEAEQLLEFLYTMALIFCQQNAVAE